MKGSPEQVPRLDFELTPACDHGCAHCYNVWTADADDPQGGYSTRGQLATPEFLAMMEKAVRQTGARHLTITGGEPLLRKDALEIVALAGELADTVTLITNGSHVTPAVARELARCGVTAVQLTLLAAERGLHDRLKGAVCFDDTVRAAVDLRAAGVPVQVCFVATAENRGQLAGVLELCLALGIGSLSYNRMSPTGRAIHHVARLMPTVAQLREDLDVAEQLGSRWRIRVGTAMPIPPCLLDLSAYRWVQFGYCSTGTASPNLVVDGAGNVRSCNLSAAPLGNFVTQDWAQIADNPYPQRFRRELPAMCRGCAHASTCQGGCKESALATFGALDHPEPLVWLADHPREAVPIRQYDVPAIRLVRRRDGAPDMSA